ncbi:unnamed protein product [Sphagnum troendelagicum]|uniref:Remorin C-terminal domain-containing protein n=1 Tax=Sphagnum troendelagicum TaxID=128251 RepID=A0ABP0UXS8_9BRYO
MSVRQVATKSLGVQIPDNNNGNNHSISSSSVSANSQQKNHSGVSYNKLVNTTSKKQAANRGVTFRSGNGHHLDPQLQRGEVSPERLNKSREAVKAWLESSSSPEQLDIGLPATAAANELLQGRRSFSSSSFQERSDCTSLPNSVTILSSRDDPSTTLRSSGRVIKQLRSRDISPPKAAARAHTPNSQPAKSDVYQLHSGERYRPPVTTPALSTRRIHHLRDASEQEGLPAGSSSVTGSDYSLGAEWRAILAAAAQAVDPAAPRLHNHEQLTAAAAAVDGDGIHSEHSNYYSICAGDEEQEEAVSEAHTVEEFVSCTEHQNSPQLMFLKPPRTMKSKNHLLHHHHHHQQRDVASVLVPRELQEDRKSSEEEMKQQLIRPPDHDVVKLVPQPPPLVATAHAITATVPNNMTRNNNYTSHGAQQKLEENLESIPIITTTNITTVAPKLKAHDNNAGGGLPPRSSKVVAEELTPMQLVLLQVKQHKVESKAAAWERAKCSKLSNRYKREETKIDAWEDHQRARANISLQQVEMKLEAKRAQALEKMQNEMACAHRKAEEKKAVAEAKRAEKAAKAASDAEQMRRTGKLPWTLGCLFIR